MIMTNSDPLLQTTASRLEALANPTRLAIFRALVMAGEDGANVGTIQRVMNVPASTLTHHLQKLVKADLVRQERRSRELICRADYSVMNETVDYLKDQCCQGLPPGKEGQHGHE